MPEMGPPWANTAAASGESLGDPSPALETSSEWLGTIPVAVERATVRKRTVETTHAVIHKTVSERDEPVDALLARQDVEVERVPIGRIVTEAPAPYWDGDTWVLPVLEEQLVTEKRLFLREEIRVRTKTRHDPVKQTVRLRAEHVTVETLNPPRPITGADSFPAGLTDTEIDMSGSHSSSNAPSSGAVYDPTQHDNQIVAMYADATQANAARDALVAAGIPTGAIEVLNQTGGQASATPRAASTSASGRGDLPDEGFWGAMKNLFVPDEDAHAFSHGINQGHAMVIVTPSASMNRDRIIEVLESTDPIDFDAKLEEWRTAGYEYRPGSGATTGAAATTRAATTGAAAATAAASAAAPRAGTAETGETLKVMEERLRIGKREVAKGGVRVRSYVVERPVEEQVRLRDEQVHVERRPVDRAVNPGEAGLFQERTIEARATHEEAIVDKEARVVEEIGIRKDAQERTETVRDTVRKTEVEIEDTRPGSPTATSGAKAGQPGSNPAGKPRV